MARGRHFNDRTGQVFGSLTVMAFAGRKNGEVLWDCSCVCGGSTITSAGHLTSGHTHSCGCKRASTSAVLNLQHGHCRVAGTSSEYKSWSSMHSRCSGSNRINPHRYEGRGISVCDRWESFTAFLEDMGPKPSEDYTIERIDNDKGYSPDNCLWATRIDQARNRSTTIFATFHGKMAPLVSWCEELNLNYRTVVTRVRTLGWDDQRALSTPTPKPYVPYAERLKPLVSP